MGIRVKMRFEEMFPLGLPVLRPIPGTRNYELMSDFVYVRGNGKVIFIPKGFVTDGASIPRLFWRLVGDPFAPDYICAAVVHDFLWRQSFSWRQRTNANKVFGEILERQGVVGWMTRCELETGVWFGKVGAWFSGMWRD